MSRWNQSDLSDQESQLSFSDELSTRCRGEKMDQYQSSPDYGNWLRWPKFQVIWAYWLWQDETFMNIADWSLFVDYSSPLSD